MPDSDKIDITPNYVNFKNLLADPAWQKVQEFIDKTIEKEKDIYFDIDEEEERTKIFDKIANFKDLKGLIKTFIINSSQEKA